MNRADLLPARWTLKTMGQVAEVVSGSTPKTSEPSYWGGDIVWLTPNDLSGYTDKYIERGERTLTEAGYDSCSTKMVPAGTVLFTSRAPIGYVAIARQPVCTNQGFKSFVCGPEVDPEFVYWHLRRSKSLAEAHASGTTFLELSGKAAARIPIPIPAIVEQREIVREIEKQFTRLDAAVTALHQVREKGRRYRSLTLHAACSGRLFDTSESSGDRVTATEESQSGPGPGADLPTLPSDWRWEPFEQLAERITVGHVGPMKSEYQENGIPFLRSQNVRENRFDPEGLKYISREFHERLSKSRLEPGDVVIVRSGDVGTACVIPDALSEANCADLVVVQRPTDIHPKFAAYYMNSLARSRVRAGQVGVALTHFNTKSVARLPVPVPPIEEQRRIVEEVERRLSLTDELDWELESSLARTGALRERILSQAFSGQLPTLSPPE